MIEKWVGSVLPLGLGGWVVVETGLTTDQALAEALGAWRALQPTVTFRGVVHGVCESE
jgi:hypothetical protein